VGSGARKSCQRKSRSGVNGQSVAVGRVNTVGHGKVVWGHKEVSPQGVKYQDVNGQAKMGKTRGAMIMLLYLYNVVCSCVGS
jgi:hypothetical protein